MDSSTQETLHSDPEWFFRHCKDDVFKTARIAAKGIILQNSKVFSELELDEQLMTTFLTKNKDVMQLVELSEVIKPPPRSPLLASFIATILGRFVKDCKYHDWKYCTANLEIQPPVQPQQTTPDIKISQPIQHQLDSMNLDDTTGNTTDLEEVEETPTTTTANTE
ncbi:hypothetical protein RCL_jg26036.t1 [Rhizophagus clarus]|uniref:Uncharacterized protein n=1 Tax=Rhizophagus clarus TaxID=94130 RepID=A0A8H3KZL6_9GLOM|nr:hypothetical protein RCL_jg26036.t1 [Rhizophagus clarus]